MRVQVRNELFKAIGNPLFAGGLVVGILFSLVNIVESAMRVERIGTLIIDTLSMANDYPISASFDGISLFISWLPLHRVGLGNTLFFTSLPLLVSMPYSWSYSEERQSGYYNQVVTRVGRPAFFFSKYIAVFISGSLVVVITLLVDLLIIALICPAVQLDINDLLVPILNYSLFGRQFYTNCWIYVLCWLLVEFFWAGSIACMTFWFGAKIRLWVMVVLMPFVIIIGVDYIIMLFAGIVDASYIIQISQLFQPVSTYYNPGWLVIIVPVILNAISIACGYIGIIKHELV